MLVLNDDLLVLLVTEYRCVQLLPVNKRTWSLACRVVRHFRAGHFLRKCSLWDILQKRNGAGRTLVYQAFQADNYSASRFFLHCGIHSLYDKIFVHTDAFEYPDPHDPTVTQPHADTAQAMGVVADNLESVEAARSAKKLWDWVAAVGDTWGDDHGIGRIVFYQWQTRATEKDPAFEFWTVPWICHLGYLPDRGVSEWGTRKCMIAASRYYIKHNVFPPRSLEILERSRYNLRRGRMGHELPRDLVEQCSKSQLAGLFLGWLTVYHQLNWSTHDDHLERLERLLRATWPVASSGSRKRIQNLSIFTAEKRKSLLKLLWVIKTWDKTVRNARCYNGACHLTWGLPGPMRCVHCDRLHHPRRCILSPWVVYRTKPTITDAPRNVVCNQCVPVLCANRDVIVQGEPSTVTEPEQPSNKRQCHGL